ncbi:MAG: bifunctional (p)ppGpp synthetase/guanosine-3',5'-bis(diphosphate) 3'-pyrophosphohydrolase [Armatimonadetes bacterium]|nr:bifunctional (p)ppGpp synthetase/guanosine-3',5'-bis(diphosphate) 3'-pyrophosphohydrolase [Armatimonadota bacterium]
MYEIAHSWEDPEGLHHLLGKIREQRSDSDLKKIRFAYFTAEKAHSGQTRGSGEPYITHPLAVADILVDLSMDDDSIVAALLHDVLEDCPDYTPEFIAETFGDDVLTLVDGVTKLKFPHTEASSRITESVKAAETLRKMLLAMAKDIRVMVIKLADRLHNMMTLDGLPPHKRTRIANETLDIYAPLAARLGIWQIKWQLEDFAFKTLHPQEFQQISELVGKRRDERNDHLNQSMIMLKERLMARGLKNVEVKGRPKHLYSIHNKIAKHGFRFEDILDLIAMRVIVEEMSDCYLALGIVHDLWLPIPNLFSDHIAKPKSNGYQSLHTKVMGPFGEPLEVQIRTREMHHIAEYGVAAHWMYKEDGSAAKPGEFSRLREQLFDWSSDNRMSSDFLRSLSSDLFSEQVFAFTPKGDVIDLPAGSTPIDFAFRVHSSIGLKVVGAKINGSITTLSHKLENGDVVELITRSNAQPSLDWLEFAASSNAKSKLRAYFRKRNRGENAARGREAIERELRSTGVDPMDVMGEERLNSFAKDVYQLEGSGELLAKVGEGLISLQSVTNKLRGLVNPDQKDEIFRVNKLRPVNTQTMRVSTGIENMMIKRGKCCDPVPGEDVVGYVTRGRGLLIHRRVCPNALRFQETEPERVIALDWPPDGGHHSVQLKMVSLNRQGLLMDISTIFGEAKTNISAAKIRTLPNNTAEIEVVIEVVDLAQLNQVMTKISNFSDVISLLRMFGRTAK